MAMSEDVLKLVQTVERLPLEDQQKFFRIVDLLTLVPVFVQQRTQRKLRELLDSEPASKSQCMAGVDNLIKYLQDHAIVEYPRAVNDFDSGAVRSRRLV